MTTAALESGLDDLAELPPIAEATGLSVDVDPARSRLVIHD